MNRSDVTRLYIFEVTMHDTLLVRRRKPTCYLGSVVYGFAHRQRTSLQPFPQGLALEQLHHRVCSASFPAHIEYAENIRV